MIRRQAEIAIVMPAYNAARYLAEAIESVVAQTFTRWTMIIVDDGSRDDTAAIAEEYAECDERIRLRRQPNAGVSAARNHGYAMTSREVAHILFLDADDALEPGALETLHAALAASPNAAAAYGLARAVDESSALIAPSELEAHQRERMGVVDGRVVAWPVDRATTFEVEAVMEYVITPGTVLLRREALDQAGLFRTDLRLWEDWDLWLRVCRIADMAFVDTPVLRYRRHSAQASHDGRALQDGERHVRELLFESVASDPDKLRTAEIGYRYHQLSIARKRLAWACEALGRAEVVPAVRQLRHAAARLAGSFRPPNQTYPTATRL